MELRLDGKIALVTGGSSGLGERFATVLAESGARVAMAARRLDRLELLKAAIEERGGSAYAIALDVTKVAAIEEAVEKVEREFGLIDVLVNNSGVGVTKPLGKYNEADFDYVMDTNAKGAFFVAQSVGMRMLKRGSGRIINISSGAAINPRPGVSVYAMSKVAVVQMTRSMALEWGPSGINVNAICPGYIATELTRGHLASEAGKKLIATLPRKRAGKPAYLDGLIVYLASDSSAFINGAIIKADDGDHL